MRVKYLFTCFFFSFRFDVTSIELMRSRSQRHIIEMRSSSSSPDYSNELCWLIDIVCNVECSLLLHSAIGFLRQRERGIGDFVGSGAMLVEEEESMMLYNNVASDFTIAEQLLPHCWTLSQDLSRRFARVTWMRFESLAFFNLVLTAC